MAGFSAIYFFLNNERLRYMKKTVKFTAVALAVILIAGIYFVFGNSGVQTDNHSSNTTSTNPTYEKFPKYKIGIIKYNDTTIYNEACSGFIKELEATGFENKKNIVITTESADSSKENCLSIAKTFVNNKFDLIYAIGEQSAVAAYETTKDIPIVFSAVTDPEEAGLVESNEKPNTNVTGVSNYTPCFEQMDLISELFPDAKTVGVLYGQADVNSLLQVNIAKKEAEKIGLTFKDFALKSEDKITETAEKMAKSVDVFYLPSDRAVKGSLSDIIEIANENKIPIIAGDEDMVLNGCLATYGIDYSSLGKNSAATAVSILYNNADIKSIPVLYISECNLFVNSETAKLLSVDFSESVLQKMIRL